MRPARTLGRRLRRLGGDERGATLVTTALLLMVLLGFLGLGLDLGVAYTARRSAQNAADSAALSAAVAATSGAKNIAAEAQAVAAQYGLADGVGGVTVVVNTPPTSGTHTSNDKAVEVIITRPPMGFFSTLFVAHPQNIAARAVGVAGQAGGCLMTLDPKMAQAQLYNGVPTVNLVNCSIYDNSSDPNAMLANGGVTINAWSVNVTGGILKNGTVTFNTVDGVHTGVAATPDPYQGTPVPTGASCTRTNEPVINSGTSRSFAASGSTPFVFCGSGLTLNGNATATFGPGVYVFNGGTFLINGGDTVTSTKAVFILTNGASLIINGNSNINFEAPNSGTYSGLAVFQDPKDTNAIILNGGSTQTFKGAVYAPTAAMTLNGTTQVTNGGCTQLIAASMIINGGVNLAANCAGVGVKPIGGQAPGLVE
ncbi:pilus assembly protein TadG-related protein [Phenylobacterium sp.]|uniref:pilus assembly protein TadG-related protein n=1 Tax=Phenylobacterium sp. TaxID=1871053 RepID=UPI002DE75696|nr:pilus assembly protein TadG-related protein [Phenylobacterium sp.]